MTVPLSALQGMQTAIGSAGLGGGNAQNAALSMYFARRGGMPTTAGAWARKLGVDPKSLPSGLQKQFSLLVEASREDGQVVATEYLKRFLDADPALWQRIVSGSGIVPRGALGPLVAGAISGAGTDAQVDYSVGAPERPWTGVLPGPATWSDMPDARAKQVDRVAAQEGVDPALVAAVMAQESGGRQTGSDGRTLRSPAGALGLMQLMPGTAAQYGLDPNDPVQNLTAGARYLASMVARYGEDGGLRAYNEGPGAYERYLKRGSMVEADRQAATYAQQVESREIGFANDPDRMNAAIATRGALDMNASKQDYQFAAAMTGAGPMLVKFTGEIGSGTEALRKLVESAFAAAGALGHVASSAGSARRFGGPLTGRANDPSYIMHGRMPM